MRPLLQSPLFAICLTLASYFVALRFQRLVRGNSLVNPVLVSILLIGCVLKVAGISYATYFAGAQFIHFLLGPATVALALPLVNNIAHVRRGLVAVLSAVAAGSIVSAVSGYLIVRLLGGSREVALSMMPKAATTPIAIGVAQSIHGLESLTAVLAIASGIIVAVGLREVLRSVRIEDWRACGLAAGTAGSGIGTARALSLHELAGAFAGLGVGLNGLVTSLICPALAAIIKR